MKSHCRRPSCASTRVRWVLVPVGAAGVRSRRVDACACGCAPCTRASVACGVRAPQPRLTRRPRVALICAGAP